MPSFRSGTVAEILTERRGLQRVTVDLGNGPERAYALTDSIGGVRVGDRVVVNTTAVELGLGTGGWHVVHWNLTNESWSVPGPGHIMKMRYTSLQADVGAAEEDHPHLSSDLDGTPVVACCLHSQVGVVAAVLQHLRPSTRVAYVMTDGAALPLALSDLVATLVERGAIAATVTTGHAFGGQYEAVSLPSALALARHVGEAEVVIVGMGPGVVGTGSALGTTSVEVAGILDTTSALGGRPVLCARASDGDARPRHQGISHHTTTALELVRTPQVVPLPVGRTDLAIPAPHTAIEVAVPDVGSVLDAADLHITTMGRGVDDDPLFFAVAAAAAVRASYLLGLRR
jgi:Protein of unknown function (DUF3866)